MSEAQAPGEPPPGASRGPLVLPAVVLVLVALVHLSILSKPPLPDDHAILNRHRDVVEPEGLVRLWTHSYWEFVEDGQDRLYRPLTILTFHASRRVTHGAFGIERTINLGLLWIVVWQLASVLRDHVPATLAWLAGGVVAVHPVCGSLIQQVVGRSDLLCWLAIVGCVRTCRRISDRDSMPWGVAIALIAWTAMAVGVKENGVVVLLVPTIVAMADRRERTAGSRIRGALAGSLLAAAPLTLFLVGRYVALGGLIKMDVPVVTEEVGNPLEPLGMVERLPGGFAVVATYARLVVWPDTQFFHHPDTPPEWALEPVVGAALLAFAILAFVIATRRRHAAAIPLAICLGHTAVVGNLIVPVGVFAANRLALPYVAGLVWLLALVAARPWSRSPRVRRVGTAAIAGGATFLAAITMNAHGRWTSISDGLAFDAACRPNSYAPLACYAHALVYDGHFREAIPLLERVIAMRPDCVKARVGLGRALHATGQVERAVRELRVAGAIQTTHPHEVYFRMCAYHLIAGWAIRDGRLDDALRELARVAELDPTDSMLLLSWAEIARLRGERHAMVEHLVRLGRLHPRFEAGPVARDAAAQELRDLAAAALRDGRFTDELDARDLALVLRPDDLATRLARGHAFARLGRDEDAVGDYRTVLARTPDEPSALWGLAVCSVRCGRAGDALSTLDRLLAVQARHASAFALRGELHLAAGSRAHALADFERAMALEPGRARSLSPLIAAAREPNGNGDR